MRGADNGSRGDELTAEVAHPKADRPAVSPGEHQRFKGRREGQRRRRFDQRAQF